MLAIKNIYYISNPLNKALEVEGSGGKPHLVSVFHIIIVPGIKAVLLLPMVSNPSWMLGCPDYNHVTRKVEGL